MSAEKIAVPTEQWCKNKCVNGYFCWAGEMFKCMLCLIRAAEENKKKSAERNLEANLF